jgi:hypothetical protein
MPVGSFLGHTINQLYVQALVNHAEEPEARVRDFPLVLRLNRDGARLREVLSIYAGRKSEDVFV